MTFAADNIRVHMVLLYRLIYQIYLQGINLW